MNAEQELYLGIDVSKDSICACMCPTNEEWTVRNEPRDISKWIKTLPEGIKIAVMEATGKWEEPVAAQLNIAGIPVCVMNPRNIRNFALSIGKLAKTDKIDAKVIAMYANAVKPIPKKLRDEHETALEELVTRRLQIVDIIIEEKNHLVTARSNLVKKNVEKNIEWLTKSLDKIDSEIKTMVHESPIWREKEQILTSVKSVGTITASIILAKMPELGSLTGKQAASLAGLAPMSRESGKYKGKSFIQGGRKDIRKALFMATLSAIRFNVVINAFYLRLKKQGKPPKVAIAACMRKLLTILNALIRDNTFWRFA
jgi:transposase